MDMMKEFYPANHVDPVQNSSRLRRVAGALAQFRMCYQCIAPGERHSIIRRWAS